MDRLSRDDKTIKKLIKALLKDIKGSVPFSVFLSALDLSEQDRGYLHILLLDLCRDEYLELVDDGQGLLDNMTFRLADRAGAVNSDQEAGSLNSSSVNKNRPVESMEKEKQVPEKESAVSTDTMKKVKAALSRSNKQLSLNQIKDLSGVHNPDWIIAALEELREAGLVKREWSRKSGGMSVYCMIRESASVLAEQVMTEKKPEPVIVEAELPVVPEEEQLPAEDNVVSAAAEHKPVDDTNKPEQETSVHDVSDYAFSLYHNLVQSLKRNKGWQSVRDLLLMKVWPKESYVCCVLPALLIQMASEGKVEIRTEKDRISGVRPSVRYREGCEQISGAILAVLSSIPSPEAAEVSEAQEAEPEQPVKAEDIQDQIPEELFAVVADEDSEQKDNAAEEEADGIPKEEESVSEKEESEDGETDVSSDEGEADTAVGTDGEDVPDDDWQERAQVPYGYRDTPNGFAIVESEAEVVRAIFKMRSRKMILQAIADHLNELGIGSKTGKQFYAATVGDILRKFKLYQGKKMSRGWFFPAILDDHFLERYNPISDKKEETAVTTEEKKPEESAGARAVPYGYEYVDKEIRIEPLEAECVRALFEMYDRGDPRSSLIGKLFARGYRGRDGHGITQGLVMEILGNRQLYTGSTGYPAILKENALKPEPEQQHEEPVKTETEPEKKPEQASVVESVQAPATQEEIQEEIYRVLYENPGFHSIEAIKSLSAKLKLLPDFKIIFNANILKSRNLIDEILTSPPDVVMYLYASKVQAPLQQAVQDTAPEASIDVKPQAELSKDKDVLDFLEYCRVTPMSYAYKMILIMAFIKHANDMGNMHIDDAVQFFRQYYDDRRSRGLRVEKGNTIFADPGAATGSMRRNIIDNPVRALKSGGYFTYDSRNEMLSLRHFVWSKLNERVKEEVVNICQNRLKEYFGEI